MSVFNLTVLDDSTNMIDYVPTNDTDSLFIPERCSLCDKGDYMFLNTYNSLEIWKDTIILRGPNRMISRDICPKLPVIHDGQDTKIDISARRSLGKSDSFYSHYGGLYMVNDNIDTVPVYCWNKGKFLTINDLLYVPLYPSSLSSGTRLSPADHYFNFSFLNLGLSFIIKKKKCNPFIFKSIPGPGIEITVTFEGLSVMNIQYITPDNNILRESYRITGDFNLMKINKLLYSDFTDMKPDTESNASRLGGVSGLSGKHVCFWSQRDMPLEYMVVDNILFANQVRVPSVKNLKMRAIHSFLSDTARYITEYIEYKDITGIDTLRIKYNIQ